MARGLGALAFGVFTRAGLGDRAFGFFTRVGLGELAFGVCLGCGLLGCFLFFACGVADSAKALCGGGGRKVAGCPTASNVSKTTEGAGGIDTRHFDLFGRVLVYRNRY